MLFSTYSKETMFGIQAQAYAATHNYWISMSVPANESAEQPSQFIGPNGQVVGRCVPGKSDVQIFDINKSDKQWRAALHLARPWRRVAKKGSLYERKRITDERSAIKTII